MNTAVLFSTGKDEWGTPPELYAALHAEFGFTLDVAANADNTRTKLWLGPDSPFVDGDDALCFNWGAVYQSNPICWCNPPYSRGLQHRFIAKAAMERLVGTTTVMLLPARTDTQSFHRYIWDTERQQPRQGVEVRFLKGRIRFVGAEAGAPFPSMIVVFHGAK